MPATALPFSVMIKPVGSICNLRCGYCYYSKTDRTEFALAESLMTDDVLERFIGQYISASTGPEVSFVWHGGEPSLAGIDFYRQVVKLQQHYLPEGWSCWNNLQTNGILLDDEWCRFLAEEHFDVGLSLDGTRKHHDRFRTDFSGAGSYERVVETARRLQSHGIQPDLLCTVNSSNVKEPLETYRALRELDTGWIQFIPIVNRDLSGEPGAVTPDSVDPLEFGDFLIAIFDEWAMNDLGRIDVQIFAEMSRILNNGTAGLCWMAPTCGRALIVEVDGSVYCCDHFVDHEHRIGDIMTTDLGILADSAPQIQFGNSKRDALPSKCRECTFLHLCNGGCPKDRFIHGDKPGASPDKADGSPDKSKESPINYLCAGLTRFFSYAAYKVGSILLLNERGQSPQEIMNIMRGFWKSQWEGIGRNDPCPCGSGRKAKNCCWYRRP